jgi:nucleotide-binding universal stress UspA family protein
MDLQRIVIGVDFSPASVDATRWAAQNFGRGVELILAHAVTLPEPTLAEGVMKRLQDLADSMSLERIRLEIREGNAARSLSDVATAIEADLLIVGARGERADLDRAIGTTAQHVVRESTIPVLVVAQHGDHPVSRILVPVDEDATARESLRWAALLSSRFDARVTTLHVDATGAMSQAAAPPDASQVSAGAASAEKGNTKRWSDLASESGIPSERVNSEEVAGVPAAEIASAAARNAADIIVMGRTAARSLRRAVLGSVTATLLSDPPCSVLVVPASLTA